MGTAGGCASVPGARVSLVRAGGEAVGLTRRLRVFLRGGDAETEEEEEDDEEEEDEEDEERRERRRRLRGRRERERERLRAMSLVDCDLCVCVFVLLRFVIRSVGRVGKRSLHVYAY